LAGVVLFDEKKIAHLRRDDEAFIPMPPWVVSVAAAALYGTKEEVRAVSKRVMSIGRSHGGRYTGDEMAKGPRVTTATPTRCTAGCRTAPSRRCPGIARTRR
jgi:hypothetical protein